MGLRARRETIQEIALAARLNRPEAVAALEGLASMGLAGICNLKCWHATPLGKKCQFRILPEMTTEDDASLPKAMRPSPAAQRLLDILERPMRGSQIAKALGVTPQAVRFMLEKMIAKGLVRLANPGNPMELVARSDDNFAFLPLDEVKVLAGIPDSGATDIKRLLMATKLDETRLMEILVGFIKSEILETEYGFSNEPNLRLTETGRAHPQRNTRKSRAAVPQLPVRSDRVHTVLVTIQKAGSMRILELRDQLHISQNSINALIQYLKRKQLVAKCNPDMFSPYELTGKGQELLLVWEQRQAA